MFFSCTLCNVHCVVNDFVLLMIVVFCRSFYFVQIIMYYCRQQYGPMCYLYMHFEYDNDILNVESACGLRFFSALAIEST